VCGGEIIVPRNAVNGGTAVNGASRAIAYVRPHDIEIFTGSVMAGRPAVVRYVAAAGPVAKIELALHGDERLVEAEIGRPQLHALDLKLGQPVYVRARKARIFPVVTH
jgi:sulfate transport system ATP-binding protein